MTIYGFKFLELANQERFLFIILFWLVVITTLLSHMRIYLILNL